MKNNPPPKTVPKVEAEKSNKSQLKVNANLKSNSVKSLAEVQKEEIDLLLSKLDQEEELMDDPPQTGAEKATPIVTFFTTVLLVEVSIGRTQK